MTSPSSYPSHSPHRDRTYRVDSDVQRSMTEMEHDNENGGLHTLRGIPIACADGGKDAWLFLTACFVLEMLLWGKFWTFDPHSSFPFPCSCLLIYSSNECI